MSEETVDTGAAAGASASGAAAVASSGTVSSGTASEAMIKAAMASVEGAEKKPVDAGAASAAALGAKVQIGTDGKPVDASKEPPPERWDSILANQRKLAAEEALKPYAWARDMKAEEVEAAISLVTTLKKDKVAFWRELGDLIGQKAPAGETADEAFPEADVISSDGVKVFSSDALKKTLDIFKKQLMTQFQGELRPLMEFRDGELSTRERAGLVNNAKSLAGRALTQARALPHFKENEPAIVAKLQAMDPAIRKEVGPVAAMYMAFEAVKAETVYPTWQAESDKRVRAEYDKKAAASGGIHPIGGDGKVRETPVIKGQSGIAAHMERLEKSNDPRFAVA